MANTNNFEAAPAYAHYHQGQENVPPGGYPAPVSPRSDVNQQKVHSIYPNQNQPAAVISPGPYYGAPPQQQAVIFFPGASHPNAPQDHLLHSILVTIFCCWLVGIFAIIRALECRSAVAAGDLTLAERKSRETKKLALIALGVGIGIYVLLVIIAPIAYTFGGVYRYGYPYGYPYG